MTVLPESRVRTSRLTALTVFVGHPRSHRFLPRPRSRRKGPRRRDDVPVVRARGQPERRLGHLAVLWRSHCNERKPVAVVSYTELPVPRAPDDLVVTFRLPRSHVWAGNSNV